MPPRDDLRMKPFQRPLSGIRRQSLTQRRIVQQPRHAGTKTFRLLRIAKQAGLSILEEARDAVQVALDQIANGTITSAKRTRQNLQVERASLYGFLANDRARRNAPAEEIWSSYEAARTAIRKAVSVTDTYFPLDVGLSVCRTELLR